MSSIRIEYDNQPEEIVTKFQVVLEEFRIAVIEELQGDGYIKYSIHKIEDDKNESQSNGNN